MTVRKIKIHDIDKLRDELDLIYEEQNQIVLAKWSIEIARRIIDISGLNKWDYPEIEKGFELNRNWQLGEARVYDIRQAGFAIHKIAREQKNEIYKNVFRTIGQAIGTGHMKEHAMVTSDYSIKVINLKFPKDTHRVEIERKWQIMKLKEIVEENREKFK